MGTTKAEFINRWSTFWMLQKQASELTAAFENELNALIEQEGISKKGIDSVERFGVKEIKKPDWCTEDKHVPGCTCL